MATTATRLESDGTLLLNGEFDEYTYTGNADFASRTASNAVYVTGVLDEVTYNLTSPTILNQTTYSQEFENAAWSKSGSFSIIDNSATAPDGSQTAAEATGIGSGVFPNIARNYTVTAGQVVTYSIYAKYVNQTNVNLVQEGYGGGYAININVQTGAVVGSPGANVIFLSTNAGNGWYRISTTYTIPSGQTTARPQFRIGLYDGSSYTGSKVLLWGAQFQIASAPTIYQPIAAADTLIDTSMRQRVDSSGNQYVADIFDEFTGVPLVDGNLILWLDAGQSTSYTGTGTTWTDLSTNSLNGTLVNTPTFDSQGWIVFDRTQSERVDFGDSASVDFTGTAPYTLEAWVHPLSNYPTQTYAGIFNHESNLGGGRDGWNMWLRGNAAQNTTMTFATERFALGSQNAPSFSLNESVVVNNWHHIVTTYDGTNIRMYRNGNLAAGPSASSLSITNTTVTMNIASRGTGSYFNGRISIARIYNRALTTDEVEQNFDANRRRYGI